MNNILESGIHLAILIPCWVYFLFNSFGEPQGFLMKDSHVSTPLMHDAIDFPHFDYRVYVGDVGLHESRWWKTVPAPGQGWRTNFQDVVRHDLLGTIVY